MLVPSEFVIKKYSEIFCAIGLFYFTITYLYKDFSLFLVKSKKLVLVTNGRPSVHQNLCSLFLEKNLLTYFLKNLKVLVPITGKVIRYFCYKYRVPNYFSRNYFRNNRICCDYFYH